MILILAKIIHSLFGLVKLELMAQTIILNILDTKARRSRSKGLPRLHNIILLKGEERVEEGNEIKKEKPQRI